MKTAMEKKETGLMRQIGHLSFVVVLLYGLTLFAVSCDNDEDPPLPPAVEKVVLAFGVDQGEGHCLRRGFRRGASDLCTYKKQNDSDICLKNQKSIFRIVQNDIATVEHKDRSSYKME